MSIKINDLAYNQKLSVSAIHFVLYTPTKTLFKSIACKLRPLNNISGHKGLLIGFKKRLAGIGFAKLSTSVGMGTYKHLRINPPFKEAEELLNG